MTQQQQKLESSDVQYKYLRYWVLVSGLIVLTIALSSIFIFHQLPVPAAVTLTFAAMALLTSKAHPKFAKILSLAVAIVPALSLYRQLSPNGSLAFTCLGISLYCTGCHGKAKKFSQSFAVIACAVAFTAILGYFFNARELYQIARHIPMHPLTAFSVCLISMGLMASDPEAGFFKVLFGPNPSGILARRMIIAAVTLPIFVGWIGMLAEQLGFLDHAGASALVAVIIVFIFAGNVWITSGAIWSAESALRESEEEFRSIFELVPLGMGQADIKTGKILGANKKLLEITGYTLEEIKSLNWIELTHPEERPLEETRFKELLEGKMTSNQTEKRAIKKDGSVIWVESMSLVIRDGQEKPIRRISVVQDITERKTSAENLRLFAVEQERSRSQLEAVFQSVGDGIVVFDMTGRAILVNEAEARIVGFSSAEEMKKDLDYFETIFELSTLDGKTLDRKDWPVSRVLRGERIDHLEVFGKRKDTGQVWTFSYSGAPAFDANGKQILAVVITRDISELKKTEADLKVSKEVAEKANFAKTQFLANMSHEIRTPIGAIAGFVDLLRNTKISEVDRIAYMNIIERNSNHLLRLIDDILDLSKVEAGKMNVEKNEFSFMEFLSEFSSAMKFRAGEKGLDFNLESATLLPEKIVTDPVRLRQILTNVIGNAIKFTDRGYIRALVAFDTETIRFVISDTGSGISAESRQHLFQPFTQGDPSTSRKYGGSGLGLILSRRLARMLGGDLILKKSELGVGSTFEASVRVSLPTNARMVKWEEFSEAMPTVRPEKPQPQQLTNLRALVVEDSPENRILISTYLKKEGASVQTAVDGKDGYQKALAEKPDVILMDIQMPVMDGHEATRALRAAGYSKPIIALTAHAMREERERSLASGFNDFLTKPIRRSQLIDVLSRYLLPTHGAPQPEL